MVAEKSDPDLTELVNLAIDGIARESGVSIPRIAYPEVFFREPGNGSVYIKGELKGEHPKLYIDWGAGVSRESRLLSVAEEAGHFVREYVRRESGLSEDKRTTQEFFGYLGKKIFSKYFSVNPSKFILTRKEALEVAREERKQEKPHAEIVKVLERLDNNYKQQIDSYRAQFDDPSLSHESQMSVMKKATELVGKRSKLIDDISQHKLKAQSHRFVRESYLVHARGYGWAEALDLSKVNLHELYTLPDSEVRKRFFTDKPQYVAGEKRMPGNTSRGIEHILGLASLIFFLIVGVSFFVTGRVIDSGAGSLLSFREGLLWVSVVGILLAGFYQIYKIT